MPANGTYELSPRLERSELNKTNVFQITMDEGFGRCIDSERPEWVGASGTFSPGRDGAFSVTLTNEHLTLVQYWYFGTNNLALVEPEGEPVSRAQVATPMGRHVQ